jgi:CO/xanthine dehydrogenase Mo-binding subunit
MVNFAVVGQSVYRKDAATSAEVEVDAETGKVKLLQFYSVGDTGTLTVSAAIANAIEDAIGVRMRDLPIMPEKILHALAEKSATVGPKG